MAYRIIFLDEVDTDISDGITWYRDIKPGLEEVFKRDLSRMFSRLVENPKLFREISPGIRMGVTKRFRFRVVYELRDRHVIIAAIVHPKRHESRWKRRLGPGTMERSDS